MMAFEYIADGGGNGIKRIMPSSSQNNAQVKMQVKFFAYFALF